MCLMRYCDRGSGGIAMYRVILCATAALLVAIVIQPATADDTSVCLSGAGDDAIAACSHLIAENPKSPVAYNGRGTAYGNKGAGGSGHAATEACRMPRSRHRPA
jgi:hypothetical protein